MADDDGVVVTSDGRRIRPVKSVTRAIEVLDALGDGESMGLNELASAIGCSKTAAYNLVTTLELRGLVRKVPDHRYALGWKLLELGEVVRWSSTFGDAAHAEVVALSESTGETAILGVLDRDTTVCVELVESSRSVPLAVACGRREPADEGAVGQVLVAFSPAARRRRMIEHLDPEGAGGLALRVERVRERRGCRRRTARRDRGRRAGVRLLGRSGRRGGRDRTGLASPRRPDRAGRGGSGGRRHGDQLRARRRRSTAGGIERAVSPSGRGRLTGTARCPTLSCRILFCHREQRSSPTQREWSCNADQLGE